MTLVLDASMALAWLFQSADPAQVALAEAMRNAGGAVFE